MATLVEATAAADIDAIRLLFAQYAAAVDEPCCFSGFERELAALPEGYFALLLALEEGNAAGCVGVRALDIHTAEMKRLFVRPDYRGLGLGRTLAQAAVGVSRRAGYRRIVLDSLPKMSAALALYRTLGFREIGPYLSEPTPGARCFELNFESRGSG